MGLFDEALQKAKTKKAPALPAPPKRWHVPKPDEAMLHSTVLAGTHGIMACSKCPRWFRYGIKEKPEEHQCECGKKGTLRWHKKGKLAPQCNYWRDRPALILAPSGDSTRGKKKGRGVCRFLSRLTGKKTHCPLERAANAKPGECISHPLYPSRERMLDLFKREQKVISG